VGEAGPRGGGLWEADARRMTHQLFVLLLFFLGAEKNLGWDKIIVFSTELIVVSLMEHVILYSANNWVIVFHI
jgi:hypothetical protein